MDGKTEMQQMDQRLSLQQNFLTSLIVVVVTTLDRCFNDSSISSPVALETELLTAATGQHWFHRHDCDSFDLENICA